LCKYQIVSLLLQVLNLYIDIFIIIVFNRQFNLLDKSANLDLICIISSFNFVVVITIICAVTILITLNFLNINTIAICTALVLRACFIRIFRLIDITNLFVVNTSFCTNLCITFVNTVLRNRFFVVAVITVSPP